MMNNIPDPPRGFNCSVTIIVDASHCPDTGAAGYGCWIASARGKRPAEGQFKKPLSNSALAEAMAIVNAIYIAIRSKLVLKGDKVLLQSDCMSAINVLKGWDKPFNKESEETLNTFKKLVDDYSLRVSFKHVKGHTNRDEARYRSNNMCDKQARRQMRKMRKILLNKETK